MSLTPPKKKTILKTSAITHSVISTAVKTQNNVSMRASGFNTVREIPLDPKAQYAISYVPGMVEHNIETGKTFEEAKMKIVLLTCEIERINTYNYSLVRENEVLRIQANKSERERDLETKLAIVLAENEKLNQVIEEVYEVYMSQRGFGTNEEYERRIVEVYEELDDWKQRYNVLENQNVVQLQNAVQDLQTQRELLNEQLTRKERDLEAMRARIAPADLTVTDTAALVAENNSLKQELEALKLKYGRADGLQLKLNDYDNKVRTVLAENEKLNDLLAVKVEEITDLRIRLEESNNPRTNELHAYTVNAPQHETVKKSAAVNHNAAAAHNAEIVRENDELRQQLEYLKAQLGNAQDFEERLQIIMGENQRLVNIISEKERELAILRDSSSSSRESQATVERLSDKIRQLLSENDKLHKLLDENNRTTSVATEENRRLKDTLEAKLREMNNLSSRVSDVQSNFGLVQDLKEKIVIISQENEKLNTLLDIKRQELEGLSRRINQLETSKVNVETYEERIRILSIEVSEKQRETENLKFKVYEAQNNNAQIAEYQSKLALVASENERLNRELEVLRLRVREDKSPELKQQVNALVSEKYQLEALLKERERDQENMRNSHVRSVEISLGDLRGQNESLKNAGIEQKRKIGELEGRVTMLLALESRVNILNFETEKLQNSIADKDALIQSLSTRLAEREREVEELRRRLSSTESRLVIEHERKLASLRSEMEVEIRRIVQEKRELEENARSVTIEFERLQTLILTIKSEVNEWKVRYNELEQSRNNTEDIDNLKRQFEALKSMNLQIKDLQQKFSAERSAYETQILQLGQLIEDLEYQKEMLTKENERITSLSVQRLSQIEELRVNNNEESLKLEVFELRAELERVKSASYDVKQLAIQYNTERAADKSKINELLQINASYREDIDKLQALIEQRKFDVESMNKQNEELRRICEKLNQQNRASIASTKAETIEILETRVFELERSRNDYQRQAERNAIELTRKNRDLVDKISELDVIKLKYEEALANYQALNNQVFARLSVGKF